MKKRNCFIGQSGGPTTAINASLAGIIAECMETKQFEHVYGMINGIKGLLEDKYMDLLDIFKNDDQINHLKHSPAMYLGSCRYKLPTYQEDPQTYELLFQTFEKLEITDFYYIGGNDSMDTVAKLSTYAATLNSPIRFIGIPKTIDNDLMGTDHTPGFGSAAKYVATSMLEIAYDSSIYKLNAVTIVEIMGRNAGWLTAASALARTQYSEAPDLIYLPEVPFNKENFLNDIREVFKRKRSVIIAVSEGIRDENGEFLDSDSKYAKRDAFGHILHSGTGKVLETMVYQEFKCKVRSIELNVLQRCAMHIASQVDLDESFQIGRCAVETSMAGHTGVMMVFKRTNTFPYTIECDHKDVASIANLEQRIPVEWINEAHNDITQELYDYLFPLIQGEVTISYENGIPQYANITHLNHD
ncbi:MAG: 6-phosphofructokinase [Longibaculum sp.]